MQNRFVADVGDFGKYGLLRALLGMHPSDQGPRLRLGIHWYLTPDGSGNNHGRHTRYLDPTAQNLLHFRECDPDLYDALGDVLQRGRDLKNVEEAGIFPADTRYFNEPLSFSDLRGPRSREPRLARREQWTRSATENLSDCDLVFVDPDNGLEASSTTRYAPTGPQYLFYDELGAYLDRGQSLVIYHHIGRQGTAESQARERAGELRKALNLSSKPDTLLYRRGSVRAFFIVPAERHAHLLRGCVQSLVRRAWARHFQIL